MSITRSLVDYLNKLRRENGVPPVNYANTGTANLRVNYMLKERLFSHYDRDGRPPTYYFTSTGNYYGAEESIGFTSSNLPYFKDGVVALKSAKQLIYNMVYKDEDSDWGHRDSVLDPCFNYADVSIAWDERYLFLDIIMVADWINWENSPKYTNGIFSMKGKVNVMIPDKVLIFYDEPSPSYTQRRSYDYGKLIAGVLPKDYYFEGVSTITASKWRMDGVIDVEFPLKIEKGIYTIVVTAKDPRGITWSPKVQKSRIGMCNILTYSIKGF
ncbi:CAP domain-containing protein [Acidianus sp. HS-5]|uniref:CAP domain-containing protein n=1 Tax=Acidianus sp. HS-5 TaxID=2886040 RepID=UPI001F182851|nr:CAP domain-containing protein [Acidianus sp. HS-5]BDC17478.1 hypothetical protein HS5_03680 [Acidianus sp. HS-5]